MGKWRFTLWLCQQLAIEHDHRNSGFSQLENGDLSHSFLYVYQRVLLSPLFFFCLKLLFFWKPL